MSMYPPLSFGTLSMRAKLVQSDPVHRLTSKKLVCAGHAVLNMSLISRDPLDGDAVKSLTGGLKRGSPHWSDPSVNVGGGSAVLQVSVQMVAVSNGNGLVMSVKMNPPCVLHSALV